MEEHFYAYGTGVARRDADPVMTGAEADIFSPLAQRLRESVGLVLEPRKAICEFLAHIEVRTKAFRDYVSSACEPMAAGLSSHVLSPELFRPYLIQLVQAQPDLFREMLAHANVRVSLDRVLDALKTAAGEPYTPAELSRLCRFASIPWAQVFREAMKVGHVEALLEELASERRMRQYEECAFHTRVFPGAVFVQGDAPLTFRTCEGAYTSLTLKETAFDLAWLPLAPTVLLTAERPGARLPDWEELRTASVACSRNYFIASQDSRQLRELIPVLGAQAPTIGERQTQVWVQEALEEALGQGAEEEAELDEPAAAYVIELFRALGLTFRAAAVASNVRNPALPDSGLTRRFNGDLRARPAGG